MSLHVVLYQPEIPQNTGNIIRTCLGTNTKLHLIKPLGFKLDPKYVKRYSANHLEQADYQVYESYQDFTNKNQGIYYFLTRYGKHTPKEFDFSDSNQEIYLIFGRESTGIPKEILRPNLDNCIRLPANDKIRSLNLANTVAIMIYEVLGSQGYPDLSTTEPDTLKGKDWLLEQER
ncbi:MAG: tRNA (cytidine(34)-2'-O)-methyltransferase [Bacilli bacterium]|nr:tRNA (cytidine(34)-2'-O)-methyltransferase [Bacilli bacterium]MBN2877393.1 tRNA (cytidine(34)-2'-O)-methyltransferase [Bacilli bacterium]